MSDKKDDPDLQDKDPELVEQHYKQVVDGVREMFDAKRKQPAQELVPVTDNTYNYAKSLAEAIFKQHFASDEHYASGRVVWGVNDTVIGILTQIDNMVADMVRRPAQQHQPNCIFHTHHMVDELLKRFADLVAAAERNSWPAEMEAMERQVNILTDALAQERKAVMQLFTDPENQPTQHGTVTVEYLQREIAAEREACAKVCEEYETANEITATWLNIVAAAIRARGEMK